jgi:uncharacterized protein
MRFAWDEHKNRRNQAKHRVSFETAQRVFEDPLHVSVPDRDQAHEERWKTFGRVEGVVLLLVVHTVHDAEGEEIIRIISARKATAIERQGYEQSY